MRAVRLWFWWRMEHLSFWWLKKAQLSAIRSYGRNDFIARRIIKNRAEQPVTW